MNTEATERIDPQTATVRYYFRDGGRVYFWCDPANTLPVVDDWDFRRQFPDITDHDWQQLFHDAFERGETDFIARILKKEGLTEDEARQNEALWGSLMLGRIFGPRPPRPADPAPHA